jgi:hypothetical protein
MQLTYQVGQRWIFRPEDKTRVLVAEIYTITNNWVQFIAAASDGGHSFRKGDKWQSLDIGDISDSKGGNYRAL